MACSSKSAATHEWALAAKKYGKVRPLNLDQMRVTRAFPALLSMNTLERDDHLHLVETERDLTTVCGLSTAEVLPFMPVSEFGRVASDGSGKLTEDWCEECWRRQCKREKAVGL